MDGIGGNIWRGHGLDTAALLLRLTFGSLFIVHGYPKLEAQRKGTADWLRGIGLPGVFTALAGVVEFFGGIALLLGSVKLRF